MATTTHHDLENKGPTTLAVMWSLTGITMIVVAARIFIRSRILRSLGADDHLILVSTAFGIIYVATSTADVMAGYGKHTSVLSDNTLERVMLLNTISYVFGVFSFTLPKFSVATLLTRLLNPGLRQRIAIWTLIGLATAAACVNIVLLFTLCDPPEAMWKIKLAGASCKDAAILIYYAIFTGALSGLTDLYLAIYPSTVLWKLQMPLPRKLAISAALGLGAIASAMAVVKCTQLKNLGDRIDYTYSNVELSIWTKYAFLIYLFRPYVDIHSRTSVEANMVVIASSIPTLHPLLKAIKVKFAYHRSSLSQSRYKKDMIPLNSQALDQSKKSKSVGSHFVTTVNVDSREGILPDDDEQKGRRPFQIRCTDEVTVEYGYKE
ncbi:hypothetical protein BDV23DRAFT_171655 [Aspergillus alliaceus]|uniref:Rhodopsin domain-containing protein n=1 Tax=Petromyces alliaceus TaxID=209559 RepID=A0A5N7CD29_PETAA|nr:hypothetical protein BDV23DRAFT_171655 [Aspergillus alliaceus]